MHHEREANGISIHKICRQPYTLTGFYTNLRFLILIGKSNVLLFVFAEAFFRPQAVGGPLTAAPVGMGFQIRHYEIRGEQIT
jgi:hypothetical protein